MSRPPDSLEILQQAAAWLDADRLGAVATVVQTWGSSPRPAGSRLLVDAAGHFVGSVSGGCVESAVVQAAQEVITHGESRSLQFGVANEQAWEVGLACGGRIELLVQPVVSGPWRQLLNEDARRGTRVLLTPLEGEDSERVLDPNALDPALEPGLVEVVQQAVRWDQAHIYGSSGARTLVEPFAPPLRLIVVGAVHIAQALTRMATLHGIGVTVVDPRTSFANEARFPGVQLCTQWPDEALEALAPDARTAVVTLTHDPKLDEPALEAALTHECFYVGALGSRRTHAARLKRLAARGLSEQTLERIHGPVGLDIGARSTVEIATSIMAELVLCLRGRRRTP